MFRKFLLFSSFIFVIFVFQASAQNEQERATAVTIKKRIGNIKMELFAGILEPNKPKVMDPLVIILENKGYVNKIKYIKLKLVSKKRQLFIEGESALTNKNYTKIEVRGIKNIQNKGFSVPKNTHTATIHIKKKDVFIDRIN